jgi:hypothetical protein
MQLKDMPEALGMGRTGAAGANEPPPQRGMGGATRSKMSVTSPPGVPLLPRVDAPKSMGPRSGAVAGFGGAGGMPGGATGLDGGFNRMAEGAKIPPPAPKPQADAAPRLMAAPAAPLPVAPPGTSDLKAMTKSNRTEPKIALGGRGVDERPKAFRSSIPTPAVPPLPAETAALGGAMPTPGDPRMGQSIYRFGESAERAKDFAQRRASDVTEQMLRSLARRQDVPVDELRKALDRLRANSGWVPKDKEPPVAVSPDDARAYFHIEQAVPKVTPMVVREYAAPRPGANAGYLDSRDTILWQPVIVLPSDGKAKVQFHLGHAEGGYQVVVAGHTLDGRIGSVRGIIPVAPLQPTTPGAPQGQPAPVPPPAP